jgi:hypothetical protein
MVFGPFEPLGSFLETPVLEVFRAFETLVLEILGAFGSVGSVGCVGVVGSCLPEFFDPPFCPLPCGVNPTTAKTKLRVSNNAKVALFAFRCGFIGNLRL